MERASGESSAQVVSEAMTTAVVTVPPDLSAGAARRLAGEMAAHHLLVLDEGTLVGILCRCDLREADPGSPVSDCMSVPVMTVGPDQSLAAALAIMADFEVGCLPVVAGGRILGLISDQELSRAGGAARSAGRCQCHRRPRLARTHS